MAGAILFEEWFGDEHGENTAWKNEFRRHLPAHQLVPWRSGATNAEATAHWHNIEYAVTWSINMETLIQLPKLRAVLLLGAGVDHLENLDALPEHIPLVRLADEDTAHRMAMYALHWVLHYHLRFDKYRSLQNAATWKQLPKPKRCEEYTVGIMGWGHVGRIVGHMFQRMGYRISAWTRSSTTCQGVVMFNGDNLNSFLRQTNALVNILPLTTETANLLDQEKLNLLPQGTILINIGRAGTVVDKALCDALDRDHLAAAVLDTFREEPLPTDSPLWRHDKVVVTPHISGRSYARTAVLRIAENIKRIQAGEQPFPVIDRGRGY